jgi:predicted TIM-barrel fold metal-dependent hydrolase
MQLSRREFTTIAATSIAGIATNPLTAAEEANTTGWIDAHVHVWNPDTQSYPLAGDFKKADMQPASFTADELFNHCRPEGVQRIVLIQMSFYQYDHRYMNEVIASHPGIFSGVAIVDHHAENLVTRMRELADQGSRGFRLTTGGRVKQWIDDPGMSTLWREAAKNGWAACPLINPQDLPVVDALCEKHPETTVVIDHFARVGISGQIEATDVTNLCRLARFKNVHVKTSAFYALGKKQPPYDDLSEMIRRVLDAFGPERLMWASDCPFQVQGEHSYTASISLIRDRLDFLSDTDRQWLLRRTAEKVFFG